MKWFNHIVIIGVVATSFMLGTLLAPRSLIIGQEPTAQMMLNSLEQTYAEIYELISPSVVSISIQARIGGEFVPIGSGSGFVLNQDGYVVTNNHVVDGGDRIVLNFIDGTITPAEVVGVDPDSDLAVLQVKDIPKDRLHPVVLADSSTVTVGQMALAIGSPFQQRWTMTSGIISALDRSIDGLERYSTGSVIQTDTPINPGNSGGPLLNLRGEVIGVNTQIVSEDRANSGIGFAVPSNLVKRIITELIETGEVAYSYLGIKGQDVDLDDMIRLDLPNNLRGVIVTSFPSGPAREAGILFNDVILAIDEEEIFGFPTLLGYLSINTVPDDTVNMTIYRDGEVIELEVILGTRE